MPNLTINQLLGFFIVLHVWRWLLFLLFLFFIVLVFFFVGMIIRILLFSILIWFGSLCLR